MAKKTVEIEYETQEEYLERVRSVPGIFGNTTAEAYIPQSIIDAVESKEVEEVEAPLTSFVVNDPQSEDKVNTDEDKALENEKNPDAVPEASVEKSGPANEVASTTTDPTSAIEEENAKKANEDLKGQAESNQDKIEEAAPKPRPQRTPAKKPSARKSAPKK